MKKTMNALGMAAMGTDDLFIGPPTSTVSLPPIAPAKKSNTLKLFGRLTTTPQPTLFPVTAQTKYTYRVKALKPV